MGYFLKKDKQRKAENTVCVQAPLGDKHVIKFKIENYRVSRFWCLAFLSSSLVNLGWMIHFGYPLSIYYGAFSLGFLWLSYLCFPGWKKDKEKEDRLVALAHSRQISDRLAANFHEKPKAARELAAAHGIQYLSEAERRRNLAVASLRNQRNG